MAPENAKQPYAIKKNTKRQAWEFGAGSDMEKEMLRTGRIVAHPDGTFEVFTLETTGDKGETARAGDYFKVDDRGVPCPNGREYFLDNHQHLEGDWYLQAARPLRIWRLGDPACEELSFLLDTGRLSIRPENPEHCFSASLWGTVETAPADAVIVFYSVERDTEGKISSVTFNFVDAGYFSTHYRIIPS